MITVSDYARGQYEKGRLPWDRPIGPVIPEGSGRRHYHDIPDFAAAGVQREFQDLFARLGVQRRREAEELVRCVWHDDREASLSINWAKAVFNCKASGCGEKGGIWRLREIAGVSHRPGCRCRECRPPAPPRAEAPRPEGQQEPNRKARRTALRHRLADGCEELGDREMAASLRSCRRTFRVKKCENGHRFTAAIKCDLQVCPECGSRKLAVDW